MKLLKLHRVVYLAATLAAGMVTAATQPSVTVSPATAEIRVSATKTFYVSAPGVAATSIAWQVVSTAATHTGSLGTVTATGLYTAPATLPVPNTILIRATDTANTTLTSTSAVTLLNPDPTITSIDPTALNINRGELMTITGTGFVTGTQVLFDGKAVATKSLTSTVITLDALSTLAAGTKITVMLSNPLSGNATSNTRTVTINAPVQVQVTPDKRSIRCLTQFDFTSRVLNNSDQTVTWKVNGKAKGDAVYGTISDTGMYTAPALLPDKPAVTITAVSVEDPKASASVTLNLENPTPAIKTVTPNPVNTGTVTLTVNGTGFAKDAAVYFAGTAWKTTWVSEAKLTATGTVAMPLGRLAAVKVQNPAPGTEFSNSVILPVRVAAEKMTYVDAVRFLEMATWGPTPASVAHLQTIGCDAWLAEQFAKPASVWPDPADMNEGTGRLQDAFFTIAMTGDDQLRQRVAFALAQIMVVSSLKDMKYEEMVGYQRLLGASAFGTYRDLLGKMTLTPAMGIFLDMVNNDKANPKAGTAANENYAREVMQLFSLGLNRLNMDGTVIPGSAPEYDQSTVTEMAKVMTGWTYAPDPGFASHWKNPEYDFLPMVSFADHHDETQKTLDLPIPCVIAANGTPQGDLDHALDCIAKQTNVAPFISYRLIQRLVMSSPSPAYVARVATVFHSTNGSLQATVTAILTDVEAKAEGTGKLREPVLYATTLMRAMDAKVTTSATGLSGQATAMGQTVMAPASVFSYFSPFYRIPGMVPPPVAPEFQAVNAATSLARANYAYKAVNNQVSGNIKVDLTNWTDLAAEPDQLLEAVNQALYRGEMTAEQKTILLSIAKLGTGDALTRARAAAYVAAAAPQYQVER